MNDVAGIVADVQKLDSPSLEYSSKRLPDRIKPFTKSELIISITEFMTVLQMFKVKLVFRTNLKYLIVLIHHPRKAMSPEHEKNSKLIFSAGVAKVISIQNLLILKKLDKPKKIWHGVIF